MPGTTTNYGLPFPEEKDEANQGATKVAELAKKIDETFVGYAQGVMAERPTAKIKGRVYYATDTKTYSQDTGSAWNELGPGAWSNLTPGGKFEAVSGLTPQVRLEGVGKVARLRGALIVKAGMTYNALETAFTVPSGFRPEALLGLPAFVASGTHEMTVETGGVCKFGLEVKAGQSITLEGLTYAIS